MAAYPSALAFAIETEVIWEDDLDVERSTSGGLRARSFFTSAKARLSLRHSRITRDAIYNASATVGLKAFFDAWKAGTSPFSAALEPFTVTLDSVAYNVVFAEAPRWRFVAANAYDVTVVLAQI